MHSAHPVPDNKSVDFFDKIYLAAKAKDAETIKAILTKASIDIQRVGAFKYTPAGKLAAEGDFPSMNFLRIYFNASVRKIAYGLALGKHVPLVEKIIRRAPHHIERVFLLKNIVEGYADGEHIAEVEKIMAFALNWHSYDRDTLYQIIIPCLIAKGYSAKAKEVENLMAGRRDFLPSLKVSGYARGCFFNDMNKILDSISSNQKSSLQPSVIRDCIDVGNIAQARTQLDQAENPDERFDLLKRALLPMLARYGLVDEVKKALNSYSPASDLQKVLLIPVIQGYYFGGYDEEAQKIIDSMLSPEFRFRVSQAMIVAHTYFRPAKAIKLLRAEFADFEYNFELLHTTATRLLNFGHVAQANALFDLCSSNEEQNLLIKILLSSLAKEKEILSTKESCLFTLALFKPKYQARIAGLAQVEKEIPSAAKKNLEQLVFRASMLHPLLTTPSLLISPINFRANVGMAWPDLQAWLLIAGVALLKRPAKLHIDLFLSIAQFLAPLPLDELQDLSNRMFITYRSERYYSGLLRNNHFLMEKPSMAITNDAKGNAAKKNVPLYPCLQQYTLFTRPIHFNSEVTANWPTIHEWLLITGINLVNRKKLTPEVVLRIAAFLANYPLCGMQDFSNRIITVYRPEFYKPKVLDTCLLATHLYFEIENRPAQSEARLEIENHPAQREARCVCHIM
jgi:hypothetical protein